MIPITIRGNGELVVSRCTCAEVAVPSGAQTLAAPPLPAPPAPSAAVRPNGSYGQILKSSALIGGSQVANIAIRVIRTKAMAMLLGPSGFGLFGLYGSIDDLTYSIAGMGINSSGVRQIAEAAGSGDKQRIAQTAAVLRRTSGVLGLLGAAILLLFAGPISGMTFGSAEHVAGVSLLSLSVLFRLISGGQSALIQGMRRIADLARMNVLGALFGTCITIPLVYFFRAKGVVPSLVAVSAMMILTSWWYSRKIDIPIHSVTVSQVRREASALLKLGTAFMASSLMMMGVAYVVRIIIVRKVGFEATGLYQAAWTLGGLYVGFILQAMGADFYPRLTAVSRNNAECNRLANEQALVGLLLAGPGVIATLTFAPLVIALFYSAKFVAAVEVLRWISLGVMLRVITWPMGFIIIAKGRSGLFFFAEAAWTIVAVSLTWLCVRSFGLNGAGIAFFGSYIFHGFLVYPIVRKLGGFRWSKENRRTGILFLSLVALVFSGFYLLPIVVACSIGVLAAISTAAYSVRVLLDLISLDLIPEPIRRLVIPFSRLIYENSGLCR
jgi:PST family polysaccharide transporter